MEDFEAAFLSGDSIKRMLLYLLSVNKSSLDPITDSVVLMLTEPVQYVISRNGLQLFENAPPLPFSHMNADQKQLIYEVVSSLRSEVPTYGPLALVDNPLTYNIENERFVFHVQSRKLDQGLVLGILMNMTQNKSELLFNILLQRIGSRVQLSKSLVLH